MSSLVFKRRPQVIVGHWNTMYLLQIQFALYTAKMTRNVNWLNETEMAP